MSKGKVAYDAFRIRNTESKLPLWEEMRAEEKERWEYVASEVIIARCYECPIFRKYRRGVIHG